MTDPTPEERAHAGPGSPVEAARQWLDLFGANDVGGCWDRLSEGARDGFGSRFAFARAVLSLVSGYDPETWLHAMRPDPAALDVETVTFVPPGEVELDEEGRATAEPEDSLVFAMRRARRAWLVEEIVRRKEEA